MYFLGLSRYSYIVSCIGTRASSDREGSRPAASARGGRRRCSARPLSARPTHLAPDHSLFLVGLAVAVALCLAGLAAEDAAQVGTLMQGGR